MRSYCTRDSSCVGNDIGICSWSMSIYIYTRITEGSQDSASDDGWCVVTPICYFSKMIQVRTMHDKPYFTGNAIAIQQFSAAV